MIMTESVEGVGLPDKLGAVDYLLHRGEANPRTRSGIMALELLDTVPDWDRFRTRFENASRRVLRLRQKVVVPTLPTAAPRWVGRDATARQPCGHRRCRRRRDVRRNL
jgi:diacylglycerol O-acyltransferase